MIAPVWGSLVTLTEEVPSSEVLWDVGMDNVSLRRLDGVKELVLGSVPPV